MKIDHLTPEQITELEKHICEKYPKPLGNWVVSPLAGTPFQPLAELGNHLLYIANTYAETVDLCKGKHLVISDGAGKFEAREIDGHFFIIQLPQ